MGHNTPQRCTDGVSVQLEACLTPILWTKMWRKPPATEASGKQPLISIWYDTKWTWQLHFTRRRPRKIVSGHSRSCWDVSWWWLAPRLDMLPYYGQRYYENLGLRLKPRHKPTTVHDTDEFPILWGNRPCKIVMKPSPQLHFQRPPIIDTTETGPNLNKYNPGSDPAN
jgi:hypothetical protein